MHTLNILSAVDSCILVLLALLAFIVSPFTFPAVHREHCAKSDYLCFYQRLLSLIRRESIFTENSSATFTTELKRPMAVE